ncbi:MAG: hypothetical protein QME94_14245 [Anaerolineae bacterium]|nr:hypothetical protein [Anaerolineae bacterium]
MPKPNLTFFSELDTPGLLELFADNRILADLGALDASVSMGLLELSPERAAVVRRLQRAGIPVVAWQLLAAGDGYWYNANNAPEAAAGYAAFAAWTAREGLHWAAVGLDLELDRRELDSIRHEPWRVARTAIRRVLDVERHSRACAEYRSLLTAMRADGYAVEAYVLPTIVDERRAGSTLLQRVLGVVDVPAQREVLMLYTSLIRPLGVGLLWSYGRGAQAIGVGSTGGGVDVGDADRTRPLDWDEFSRDLRLAARLCSHVYVFSLEGCAQQGFLPRLKSLDWEEPVAVPLAVACVVETVRAAALGGFWVSARLGRLLTALFRAVSRPRATSESGGSAAPDTGLEA